MKKIIKLCLSAFLLNLIACTTTPSTIPPTPAPVVNGIAKQANNSALTVYPVQKSDTLYSVAWRFGRDYKELAVLNHLTEPYDLHPSETLCLKAGCHRITHSESALKTKTSKAAQNPHASTASIKSAPLSVTEKPVHFNSRWQWPAMGPVIKRYSTEGNKGVDIAGRSGEEVLAAASGKVVYSGSGLRGYGRLIILKHNEEYLSAYAHNKTILVKEGQIVNMGQKIAEMGNTDAPRPELHFEIRKNGHSVNPLEYLPQR
ncbi:MAG: LysM peptidoglycan-binding protein [Gammaproteobacteria bacterium]|nr:LysM peptidoglycan-binding protein [Gammaproteobacteria bacterium]